MTQIIDQTGFIDDTFSIEAVPLEEYAGGGAVLLSVEEDLTRIEPLFPTLKLIVLPFAKSADGRAFSIAAELRERGFQGHLRARGHILVDQLRAALRSGFDDIEITDEQAARMPEHQWRSVPLAPGYRSQIFGSDVGKQTR